jgi:type III pantothenate kinase
MTCLLIDIGNSRIKYAFARSNTLSESVLLTIDGSLETQLLASLRAQSRPEAITVGNVAAPNVLDRVTSVTRDLGWPSPLSLRVQWQTSSLRVGYEDPDQLGVDRWLGMLGARSLNAVEPLVVIDAGTAITLDAIDANGQHLGGGIAPGLNAMRTALPSSIRPALDAVPPSVSPFPATNTRDAIDSATLLGLADLVTGLLRRLKASLSAEPTVFMTGGDAPKLAPFLVQEIRYEPALVMYGLLAASRETQLP